MRLEKKIRNKIYAALNSMYPTCSICGRRLGDGLGGIQARLFMNHDQKILMCSDCVQRAYDEMNKHKPYKTAHNSEEDSSTQEHKRAAKSSLMTPKEIKKELDRHVIGQERAKRVLAVSVYNHYKRLNMKNQNSVPFAKSNVLIVGPTGCGKTLLARSLAEILDVPFVIADATSITEAGYVGDDVESILVRLLNAADGDVARAEKGIVYIDEIDKIGRKSAGNSITKDVSGEGVQQALLKILEGTIASIPMMGNRKVPSMETVDIDTHNILFICGGSFEGMSDDKVVRAPGFSEWNSEEKKDTNFAKKLMNFGMIPELIGRFPVITQLDGMDKDTLIRIMTDPEDSILNEYKALLKMDGVRLKFTQDALSAIADSALEQKSGARGLRAIVEDLMVDVMFRIPSDKSIAECVITRESLSTKEPYLVHVAGEEMAG